MYRCETYHFFKYEGNHLANMPSSVVSVTAGDCGQVIYAYITGANTQRGGKYIFTQTPCALLWVLLVPVWYACAPMLIPRGKRNREEAPASLPRLVGSTHFAKIPSGVLCFTGRLYHSLPASQALPSWHQCPLVPTARAQQRHLSAPGLCCRRCCAHTCARGSGPFHWHCCPLTVR